MKDYDLSQFRKDIEEFQITLSEKQLEQYLMYYELLIEWNEKVNLTSITEYDEVMKKHFLDSISLIKAIDPSTVKSVIDVGTGAGFPGLALKIAFPNLDIFLLDSLGKRVTFLNTVIEKLQLSGITAEHGRAEDFAKKKEYRESFDLCVSRAVANLAVLSEYCIPFVKNNGYFIPYKSEKAADEIEQSQNAIRILGGTIEKQVEFQLPNSDIYRNLIMIKKIKNTPPKYPRKAGLPTKEPLA